MIDVSDLGFKRDDNRHTSSSSSHQAFLPTNGSANPSRSARDPRKNIKPKALALLEQAVDLDTY
jgi:hypothetical protein